jgi:hypothetical protein
MKRMRSLFCQVLLTGALTTLLLPSAMEFSLTPLQAQAQRAFKKPSGTARGNIVRGPCLADSQEKALISLLDESTYTKPILTIQERPTFLFYLPYSRTPDRTQDGRNYSVVTAEFELLDENEKSVLKNQKIVFSLPEKSGIVKVKLPSTEASLEPNKEYFWIFRIICDSQDYSANPSVAGWIKRVRVGSSENLWFDRLEQLAQTRTNHLDSWTEFLRQFDVQNLAQQEIVELKPEEESSPRRQGNRACSQPTPD